MGKTSLMTAVAASMFFSFVPDGLHAVSVDQVPEPEYRVVDRPQVDLAAFPMDEEGYYLIFNGRDLTGWRTYGKDVPTSGWSVEDGCIRLSGSKEEGLEGGDLLFAHKFRNFILEFDWKLPEKGNSGLFYLAREVTAGNGAYVMTCFSAPEYQLYDDSATSEPKYMSASLYDMIPPSVQNSNPAGEWNHAEITVSDGRVVHGQNGKDVLEYYLWTPEWTAMLQNSKFSQEHWPLAFELLNGCGGDRHEGYIVFQDHGNDAWFRNIRIKVL